MVQTGLSSTWMLQEISESSSNRIVQMTSWSRERMLGLRNRSIFILLSVCVSAPHVSGSTGRADAHTRTRECAFRLGLASPSDALGNEWVDEWWMDKWSDKRMGGCNRAGGWREDLREEGLLLSFSSSLSLSLVRSPPVFFFFSFRISAWSNLPIVIIDSVWCQTITITVEFGIGLFEYYFHKSGKLKNNNNNNFKKRLCSVTVCAIFFQVVKDSSNSSFYRLLKCTNSQGHRWKNMWHRLQLVWICA